jgi:hypothetical protein
VSTIPASEIVRVVPSVLSAGGSALDLQALILTTSSRVPYGVVQAFTTALAVGNYFGLSSDEYFAAQTYFLGFNNSTVKPDSVLFVQYPAAAVAAYLRGGSLAGVSLATLQGLSGSLTITMDGYAHVIASIDLSTDNSQSAMAAAIQAALTNPSQATCSAGTIAGTVLTVAGTLGGSGTFQVGQTISGTDVTVGTTIISLGTGTGGVGTYNLSASSTVGSGELITASATPVVVTYDSVSSAFVFTSGITGVVSTSAFATGTLAASLKLTSATGAVLSQGAAATTPGPFMDMIVQTIQNWATFMTIFNPDNSGNTNKLAFAAWTSAQLDRYAYVCWDADASPTTQVPATQSLGYLIAQAAYDGTWLQWCPTYQKAAFVCGIAASIDFNARNGRTTFAFRAQDGLVADVTNVLVASNLIANGYNFYGAYATANDQFVWIYTGQVSGQFQWMDSYIDEIWFNNALQLALMVLFGNAKSIPYNRAGYSLVEAALADPIIQAGTFGIYRPGVTLSAAQVAEVNAAAGANIAPILSLQGYYLQVLDASPSVRQARGSPPCNLWYCDGQSIQKITLASILVQ